MAAFCQQPIRISRTLARTSTLHPYSHTSSIPLQSSLCRSFSTTSALLAVPKKKTSHSKRRHRQLAGKGLKDVIAVVNCPGCGRPKKAHFLCPYCVAELKFGWLDQYVNNQGKVAQKRLAEQEKGKQQEIEKAEQAKLATKQEEDQVRRIAEGRDQEARTRTDYFEREPETQLKKQRTTA